jgi:hypothetical protein
LLLFAYYQLKKNAEAKPKRRLLDSRTAVEFLEEEALNGLAPGEREPKGTPERGRVGRGKRQLASLATPDAPLVLHTVRAKMTSKGLFYAGFGCIHLVHILVQKRA